MLKSIVLEGSDGVGKTTLAKEIAHQINHELTGHEAFVLSFPSNGMLGFRKFFLAQQGGRPIIQDGKVVWSGGYTTSVPPITNLLHILADFSYVYKSLPVAPDVESIRCRGNIPVIVIDRELLSTVVYQIIYAFPSDREEFDVVKRAKQELFSLIQHVVDADPALEITHDLLVHLGSSDNQVRMTENNTFDRYDQRKIQHAFSQLFTAFSGENVGTLRNLIESGQIEWLSRRFTDKMHLVAFSASSAELASSVVARLQQETTNV